MQDISKRVSEIFKSPVGVFPRGGLEASLKVNLASSPQWLRVTKDNLEVTLSFKHPVWIVAISDGETTEWEDLEEAIVHLLLPFLKAEVTKVLKDR